MPICRNCKARISKFDKDICPVCGTKQPLQGVSSDTVEITAQVDISGLKEERKVLRNRKSMLLLFIFCGFTGSGFFYLKKKKTALVWLLSNLVFIPVLFLMFYFPFELEVVLSIVFSFVVDYIINAVVGAALYLFPNLKDGEGEFVS